MQELINRLDRLFLKLDHTALLIEQSLSDALEVVESGNEDEAKLVIRSDDVIDRREVETERECIRLLALYQPAAIDLRRICFAVKVNNDLERIADYCCKIAKRGLNLSQAGLSMRRFPAFYELADQTGLALRQTLSLFTLRQENGASETVEKARRIIDSDDAIDDKFKIFLEQVVTSDDYFRGKLKAVYQVTSLGRALERIGDLCSNIAEDAIFMHTGEIVRHPRAVFTDEEST